MRDLDDYGGIPDWASDDPESAVDYVAQTWTRSEIMTLLGRRVGFEHDPDHDRLRQDELARTLVFVLALTGEL